MTSAFNFAVPAEPVAAHLESPAAGRGAEAAPVRPEHRAGNYRWCFRASPTGCRIRRRCPARKANRYAGLPAGPAPDRASAPTNPALLEQRHGPCRRAAVMSRGRSSASSRPRSNQTGACQQLAWWRPRPVPELSPIRNEDVGSFNCNFGNNGFHIYRVIRMRHQYRNPSSVAQWPAVISYLLEGP